MRGRAWVAFMLALGLAWPGALAQVPQGRQAVAQRSPALIDTGGDERIGDWTLIVHHDRMNDHTMHIAIVTDRFNQLAVKCDNPGRDSVYVGFYTNRFLGGGDDPVRLFRYRIDQRKPEDAHWVYSATYAHLIDPPQVRAFLDRLKTGHTVLVHAFDALGTVIEANFKLDGAADAISRLEQACR